ncbi:MAG: hypothetical protein LBV71_14580 [Prevotella sp.]|nr:hypothetical protein [Prevotella sp.]
MKRLFFCFSFVIVLMACSTRPTIEGRWAMEMDHNQDTAFVVRGDTIVAPELRFERDTMYMEVRTNGVIARSECMGVYSIQDNLITVTGRMGEQQTHRFILKDDILTVVDKDDPNKIIMRLIRIKEKE